MPALKHYLSAHRNFFILKAHIVCAAGIFDTNTMLYFWSA